METAGLLVLLANLATLALNVKLYTEILKDKSQDRRAGRDSLAERSARINEAGRRAMQDQANR